nr:hypothetical protein [Massilia sp. ZL223]
MSEMIDLKKERNFFETRVTECQTGGAQLGLIDLQTVDQQTYST